MNEQEREQAIKDHVEWCRQERDRAAEKLKLIEAGQVRRMHRREDADDHHDTTEEYKAELEHVVDKMSRLLFAFAPR